MCHYYPELSEAQRSSALASVLGAALSARALCEHPEELGIRETFVSALVNGECLAELVKQTKNLDEGVVFNLVYALVVDCMRCRNGSPLKQCYFAHQGPALTNCAACVSPPKLWVLHAFIMEVEQVRQQGVAINFKLHLETLLIYWRQLFQVMQEAQ